MYRKVRYPVKSKSKLPLKDKPLRYVAQPADEAIDDLLNDKLLGYYSVIVILFFLSVRSGV
jgi:hypothetical protein